MCVCRLYLEAPLVTDEALEMLRQQCMCPERCISALNLVHDLIVRRPPRGHTFLSTLLALTVHCEVAVREGAVARAVSIYDRSEWRSAIEEHALRHLGTLRLPEPPDLAAGAEAEVGGILEDSVAGGGGWTDEQSRARLCLYMALLPHNECLIHELTRVYVQAGAEVKRCVIRVLEVPVRDMRADSPELLALVERCPPGAETLVTRVIHVLSERGPPGAELVARVRDLYHGRSAGGGSAAADVRFLIPVLGGLEKREVLAALPKLVRLNPVLVKEVFGRLLSSGEARGQGGPVSPAELLVTLHTMDARDMDLKAVMKAVSVCLAERRIYTQEVLAVVMQQLMDVQPLPTLLMRTVIQSLALHPRLTGFVMNILQRLIVRQVWRQRVVWQGFVKCCERTRPQSFHVLLQLPPERLAEALAMCMDLRAPLRDHVRQLTDAQRAHVPQSVLDVVMAEEATVGAPPPADVVIKTEPLPLPTTAVESNSEPLPPGME